MKDKKLVLALIAMAILAGLSWKWMTPKPAFRQRPPDPIYKPDKKAIAAISKDYLILVQPIFKTSCFDCHSKNTVYPWYHAVPGVRQWMDGHIHDGMKGLDLTDGFPFKGEENQIKSLRRITRMVQRKSMPPGYYTFMHHGTALDVSRTATVTEWAENSLMRLHAPVNSGPTLEKKRP